MSPLQQLAYDEHAVLTAFANLLGTVQQMGYPETKCGLDLASEALEAMADMLAQTIDALPLVYAEAQQAAWLAL